MQVGFLRALSDLSESDRHTKQFYLEHNLADPRFTLVGLCSNPATDYQLYQCGIGCGENCSGTSLFRP